MKPNYLTNQSVTMTIDPKAVAFQLKTTMSPQAVSMTTKAATRQVIARQMQNIMQTRTRSAAQVQNSYATAYKNYPVDPEAPVRKTATAASDQTVVRHAQTQIAPVLPAKKPVDAVPASPRTSQSERLKDFRPKKTEGPAWLPDVSLFDSGNGDAVDYFCNATQEIIEHTTSKACSRAFEELDVLDCDLFGNSLQDRKNNVSSRRSGDETDLDFREYLGRMQVSSQAH